MSRKLLSLAVVLMGSVPWVRSQNATAPVAPAPGAPLKQTLTTGASEREVSFKTTDALTLPGTLTLPTHVPGQKPPIAVLVQGSGVQDRDGTEGPNKFFQQLAWGLAVRGVATLRYDRRAKVDVQKFLEHADLDHEVVIDAAAALDFAQTLPETDAGRVFLAGHSLGAQLAPDVVSLRLTQKPGSVRGVVLMSGVARPIDKVFDEQIRTMGAAQGGTPEQIDRLAGMYAAVFSAARDPETPADKPMGVGTHLPASYWRDWLRRDPVTAMHALKIPMLVTRGTKDVNATHADFELLHAATTTRGSQAHEFPGLGHLYMPIEGEPNGRESLAAGTVSAEFLDYLAAWIKSAAVPPATATKKAATAH